MPWRTSSEQVRKACYAALARGLQSLRPGLTLDERGYVHDPVDNLVEGVDLSSFEDELSQGAGQELRGKFLAPWSSTALAVNSFALFRGRLIDIGEHRGVRLIGFERRCPTGLASATPPHLDVVLSSACELIAIESKCTEYIGFKRPAFSTRYRHEIIDGRLAGPWFAEMIRLVEQGTDYHHLDVAQLIKHAFGIAHC